MKSNPIVRGIEAVIFSVRWLLPLFYLGLVVVMLIYGYSFAREVYEIAKGGLTYSTDQMLVITLNMIDVVMIANLVKMIIGGSYNSFVSKDHGRPNENVSSGTLKIKMTTSMISVGSIHLLRLFVATEIDWSDLLKHLLIFSAFIFTALALGVLELMHVKGEAIEKQHEH